MIPNTGTRYGTGGGPQAAGDQFAPSAPWLRAISLASADPEGPGAGFSVW